LSTLLAKLLLLRLLPLCCCVGNCAVRIRPTGVIGVGAAAVALNEIELYNKAGSKITWVSAQASSVWTESVQIRKQYIPSNAVDGIFIVNGALSDNNGWSNLAHTHWTDPAPAFTLAYPCSEELATVAVHAFADTNDQ
jgi:hypothetical protein